MVKTMTQQSPFRVLFNDAHANLPSSQHVPQGGPARFARIFSDFFIKNKKDIILTSLLFSHNSQVKNIFHRKTTKDSHVFFELVYPREMLISSYKKKFSKRDYLNFLAPLLLELKKLFDESRPEIVFLNGFSLSNWLIMETAYRNNIPCYIQHAGIWKKEILVAPYAFSSSIRRILSSFEKETFKKTTKQIFLNEFSRDVFFKLHSIKNSKKNLDHTQIIPLPVEVHKVRPVKIVSSSKKDFSIGMVARWDSIKNHRAVLRLAIALKKFKKPYQLKVVTKWAPKLVSNFKEKYEKNISVIEPMSSLQLTKFFLTQDIVLIPSRFDVSPTVCMEALICGKPVIISSEVGWVSDFKKFGLGKFIVSPYSSGKTITETIDTLIEQKEKYLSRYASLQEKIITEHNSKKVFEQYYQLFKSIK